MILPILKFIFMLMFVAGLNNHFHHQQSRRKFKNTNPELVKYDSIIMVKLDSALTTLQK